MFSLLHPSVHANLLNLFPETSIQVFRHFITSASLPNGAVELDASGVVGRECYDAWLQSRASAPGNPTKVFQRCLTAHITASDGRQPFTPADERAILRVIREKKVWPAFQDTSVTIGHKGFVPWDFMRVVTLRKQRAIPTTKLYHQVQAPQW